MTTAIAPAPAKATRPPLDATDRCDECGAQAYVVFEKASLLLGTGNATFMTCAHHATKHGPKLAAQGFVAVIDNSAVLQQGNRQQGDVKP